MQNSAPSASERSAEKVDLSVQIDRELLDQVTHLDRRSEDDLVRQLPRNPTVPPKGEWND